MKIPRRREEVPETEDKDRIITLCERLTAATIARRAQWREDGEDVFGWEHERGSVSIGSRDNDGQPPYELTIYNGDRVKVEELTSQLVDGERPAEWNQPLAELYRVARRSALQADEIIDALIETLPTADRETEAAPHG